MVAAVPAPSGSTVAGYRLGAQLGRGPLGRVYAATRQTGQPCSIKLFTPHRASPSGLERYAHLAGLAASTPGSDAVRLFEVVAAGDSPYVAMELAAGESLAAVLERGPLEWGEACSIVGRVARGLDALHAAGLMHGNLKPTNVMIAHEPGSPVDIRLLDVGSYVLRDHGEDGSTRAHDYFPVDFQAPEQLLGEKTGPPTDLYALGVIFYEMIAGERPFTGSIAEIAYAHLRASPPPLDGRFPALPSEVSALIMRLLDKDPAARPGAPTLMDALKAATQQPATTSFDEASTQFWKREQVPLTQTPEHTAVTPRAAAPVHQETVLLPPPPPPKPGDSGSITLIPADIGAEFLPERGSTTERRARMDTNPGNQPSATVFVNAHHIAQAKAPQLAASASAEKWWSRPPITDVLRFVRGPWPLQKKLLVINVVCMLVVLVGLAAIVSSR